MDKVMVKADIKNTLILIPVYNSGKQLKELLKRIRKAIATICEQTRLPRLSTSEQSKESLAMTGTVLCINDGSRDNSLEVIQDSEVNYISLYRNKGKGHALRIGFDYAKVNDYKYVLTIDSDLQHDPAVIPNFFKTQNKTGADLVIGFRRFSFKNMPFARVLSNTITSKMVSFKTSREILDSQSGYRLYNLDFYLGHEIKTDRYQMETEILLNYLRKRAKVAHVEIPVIYRDEKSNISHLRDIGDFLKVVFQ
jgi:glycosyltransferase involved in cell wall biosynthesis